jgi:hypothetical protein
MAASKDSTTGTPNTSAATSPHHSVPVSGDKLPEFRTPFPAAVPATRNTPYGFQAETDIDPHHSPIVGGGELPCCASSLYALTVTSAFSATIILIPSSYRDSMATSNQLPPIFHNGRESVI